MVPVLSRSDLVGAATSVAERVAVARRVAVLATPTPTTVLAIIGCLIAGVPVVPIPADVGAAERRHILTDSGAQAWLGERPDETEGLSHIPVRVHARSWHRYPEPPPQCDRDHHVHLRGPPERPRACRSAARPSPTISTRWPRHGSGPRPTPWCTGCRCSTCTVWCWACSARCGSETASCTPGKPTPAAYAQAQGTLYFGVPTVWSRVVKDLDSALALSTARLLVSGSAPLPVPVFDELVRLTGHAPVERYGSTESLITLSTRADGERRPGWVGLPLAGVQTRLVDDDGAAVPHDGETIGQPADQGPDGVRRLPQPARRHGRRLRPRRLVPHRRRRRRRSRRHAPHRRARVGGPDQVRADTASAPARSRPCCWATTVSTRWLWSGCPTTISANASSPSSSATAAPETLIEFVAQQLSAHKRPSRSAAGGQPAPQCDGQGDEKGTRAMGLRFSEICIDAHNPEALGAWWSKRSAGPCTPMPTAT